MLLFTKYCLTTIVVTFGLVSCNKLEYSPNQVFDKNTPQNLNSKNLQNLLNASDDDTVRFVLSGDTQRSYANSSDFVNRVNNIQGIDFVLLDGDISDFGLLQEMEWINQIYSNLHVPYFGVIGNHDLLAKGEDVFRRMYGELNYSFVYKGIKFICHNTNSREVGFNGKVPNIEWLKNELKSQNGIIGYIAVSHVSPFSVDFDKKLEEGYVFIFKESGNLLASLHAHDHKTGIYHPYKDLCPFIVTNAIANREFLILEIRNGRVEIEVVEY